MNSQTECTIGDEAVRLHQPILNLMRGRGGIVEREELKREAASMSGLGGAAGNALASVAIHQLERDGKIRLSRVGRSWIIADAKIPAGRPAIGRAVRITLAEGMISKLDAIGAALGETRAETVRRLLSDALS
jgi:hypothetical protein